MPSASFAPETIRPAAPPDGGVSRDLSGRMADAALEAVDCMRVLAKSGSNLVAEVLRQDEFIEWSHYPADDVYDPDTHAQYYFHAHPPGDRQWADYGHFHTFLRSKGMPPGVQPAPALIDPPATDGDSDPICHLIAISMTREGLPERLFTTNRWVTGETWYRAADIVTMLDRFVVDLSRPSWPLNRWLTAMLVLFRPQIEQLLLERDRQIERWKLQHPEVDVFEDRDLEITSSVAISIEDQIRYLAEGTKEF